MTEAEKLVWAAAYARVLYEPLSGPESLRDDFDLVPNMKAVGAAHHAVTSLRQIELYADKVGHVGAVAMYREFVAKSAP